MRRVHLALQLTSFKASTRELRINSLSKLTSSPFSSGCGTVDSESPEVDGAGGASKNRAFEGPAPGVEDMILAALMMTCGLSCLMNRS